jgi:hypothetical protein
MPDHDDPEEVRPIIIDCDEEAIISPETIEVKTEDAPAEEEKKEEVEVPVKIEKTESLDLAESTVESTQ